MPRHFQFSLRVLLLTVAAVALLLAFMFQVPAEPARLTIIALVPFASALSATGLVFGPNAMRAFCIGASVPLAMMLVFITLHVNELAFWSSDRLGSFLDSEWAFPLRASPDLARIFGAGMLSSIALGYVCVAFHWLIRPRTAP